MCLLPKRAFRLLDCQGTSICTLGADKSNPTPWLQLSSWTSSFGSRESAKIASPWIPAGNPWDTRGIPKWATAGDAHPLGRKKNVGESRSRTPNHTRHNSRKLLWRSLSHGNSLGPAHEVEPRIRRAMTSWPRYNTVILYGVGGAQNANIQTQNANNNNGCARNKQHTHIDKQNKTHTLAPRYF